MKASRERRPLIFDAAERAPQSASVKLNYRASARSITVSRNFKTNKGTEEFWNIGTEGDGVGLGIHSEPPKENAPSPCPYGREDRSIAPGVQRGL